MRFNPGTASVSLRFTAKIPADAAKILSEGSGELASFSLTPNWGTVPELSVSQLAKAGVSVDAWNPWDVVVPIVHERAFYLTDIELNGGAASFSMKGVNLRTGLPETDEPLSDKPSQSYWAPGVSLPWIDGYVPSDGQAVRQFVPLRGETEMGFDVARHAGIADDDPFVDAIRARFFAPVEPREPARQMRGGTLGGDYESFGSPGLLGGSSNVKYAGPTFRGATLSAPRGLEETTAVGMGAGARMRQRHEHNPQWTANDFRPTPWADLVIRMLWVDEWNTLAAQVGQPQVSDATLADFARRQASYESDIRRQLGIFQDVETAVNNFPSAP